MREEHRRAIVEVRARRPAAIAEAAAARRQPDSPLDRFGRVVVSAAARRRNNERKHSDGFVGPHSPDARHRRPFVLAA